MTSFQSKWSRPQQAGFSERMGSVIKPKGPLKPRVQTAITRLQAQGAKLDTMLSKLEERDAAVFRRVSDAVSRNDAHSSRALAVEVAEIRKVKRVLGNARMALQQLELRLTTAHDLGDTLVAIMPTVGLMNGMKSSLAKFMPGADQEISRMSEMLGGMIGESFSGDSAFAADASMNEESEKILNEAAAVAETASDAKFPATPADSGGVAGGEPASKFF